MKNVKFTFFHYIYIYLIFGIILVLQLAAQLATKFDIKTLQKLASLESKAVLMQHNTRLESEIIDNSDDESKTSKSEPLQNKYLGSTENDTKVVMPSPLNLLN